MEKNGFRVIGKPNELEQRLITWELLNINCMFKDQGNGRCNHTGGAAKCMEECCPIWHSLIIADIIEDEE